MKTNSYFNNLEKYWSANFLALLGSVNLFSFITWAFSNLIYFIFKASSFSDFFELVKYSHRLAPLYPIIYMPLSCYLVTFISLFYILIIISRKKWCIIMSALPIVIGWCVFFAQFQEPLNFQGSGDVDIIFFYLLPISIFAIPISLGIYLILLLFERYPKFRVPVSLISQNNIFKKYIQIFYWFYFVVIFTIIWSLIYGLSQS